MNNYVIKYINLLFGIVLFINSYFLYEYSNINILYFIGYIIFEIMVFINLLNNKKKINKLDNIVDLLYILFVCVYLVLITVYQINNSYSYSMIYFSKLLFIPNIIYSIYNINFLI